MLISSGAALYLMGTILFFIILKSSNDSGIYIRNLHTLAKDLPTSTQPNLLI